MKRRCFWRPAFLLATALLLSEPTPAADRWLSGVTRDGVGTLLARVEVVLLAEGAALPLDSTQTDEQGRFHFEGLAPAAYRVAAFKDGYLVAVARVHTGVRNALDLVLSPAPVDGEPGSERVPVDRSWVLRIPDRSPLRELAGIEATGGPALPGPARPSVLNDAFRGRVDQMYILSDSPDAAGNAALRQGTETRVELAGAFGDWGSARVEGRHESLEGGVPRSARGPVLGRRGSDFRFDLQVDPTLDSKLFVNGHYLARQAPTPVDGPGAFGSGERTWGWDARWSATLGAAARVDVRVEYDDTSVSNDGPVVPSDRRSAAASGRFERVAGDGHQLQFDFWAGVRDGVLAAPPRNEVRVPVVAGDGAMYVNMSAADTWSLSARGGLIHGLGVFRMTTAGQSVPVVVPKIGAFWRADRGSLRAQATYFADVAGDRAAGSPASVMAGSAMGYSGEATVALPFDVSFRAGVSSTPLLLGGPAGGDMETTVSDAYVTDGLASADEITAALDRTTPEWTVYALQSLGRVEGHVAPAPFFAGPGAPLAVGRIDYGTTRIGVRFPTSGTDLSVRYWTVLSPASDGDADAERNLLEARLSQELSSLRLADTAWKVLLVGRTVTERHASGALDGATVRTRSRARELSAGVAVAF